MVLIVSSSADTKRDRSRLLMGAGPPVKVPIYCNPSIRAQVARSSPIVLLKPFRRQRGRPSCRRSHRRGTFCPPLRQGGKWRYCPRRTPQKYSPRFLAGRPLGGGRCSLPRYNPFTSSRLRWNRSVSTAVWAREHPKTPGTQSFGVFFFSSSGRNRPAKGCCLHLISEGDHRQN